MKVKFVIILFFIALILFPFPASARRTTPEDIYQAKRVIFNEQLSKIQNLANKEKVIKADQELVKVNKEVCLRFDADMAIMAGILEELKDRSLKSGKENPSLESAEYWVTFAHEAVAYQKIQDYTPQNLTEKNIEVSINNSKINLKSNLNTLKGKVLKARTELRKAIVNE